MLTSCSSGKQNYAGKKISHYEGFASNTFQLKQENQIQAEQVCVSVSISVHAWVCVFSEILHGPWYPAEECSSLLKSSYQLMRIPLRAGRKGLECVSLSELGRMLITMPVSARAQTHTCFHACSHRGLRRELQSLTHEWAGGGWGRREREQERERGCF